MSYHLSKNSLYISILSSNKYFDIYIRKFNPVCTYCATSRYSRMGVAHRHFSSKEKNLGRNSRSSTSSHVILHTKLYIPSTINTWWFMFWHTIQGLFCTMAIRVVEFSNGGTKLERFLPKNQHTQRKLLNFEFWINGELSKIGNFWILRIRTCKNQSF